MKIGILAIQGDFELHNIALNKLSVDTVYVRNTVDLARSDALILPGGESTAISLLLNKYKLFDSIKDFSRSHSIFGICAGSILMSQNSNDLRVNNFNFLEISSNRNSWGSQIDSFSDYISLVDDKILSKKYYATFIRAPKFFNIKETCSVLGSYNDQAVLIRNRKHLISSFHPEIGDDLCIYKYFLKMINE